MPDIQTQDPARKLELAYNMVAPVDAPIVSPELIPVVIEDDISQIDPRSRSFRSAYYAHNTTPAVAVNHSVVIFSNPTGSNVDAFMQLGRFQTSVGASFAQIRLVTTSSPALVLGARRDSRAHTPGSCGIGAANRAGAGPLLDPFQFEVALDMGQVDVDLNLLGYVVSPGFDLEFAIRSQNQTLEAALQWWEQPIPPNR